MKMSNIVLIRHVETDLAGKFCGHSDPDLNMTGERRLAEVVEAAASLGVQRIISSDLRRSFRTAAAIGQRIGVNVELQPSLREIHFGAWEGLSWPEIEHQFPQEAGRWLQDFPLQSSPGGESYTAFSARIGAAITPLLLCETTDCETAGTTAIVTHRGVMRYALRNFFGFSEAESWARTAPYGAIVKCGVQSHLSSLGA